MNVFGPDEKKEIQKTFRNAENGRWEAADKLLMYVLSNCGDAYGKFIQCLRELGYREIVNVLENTTNGKNKTNLMTEQDKTRHQLEDLHKDHDLTKQELKNLRKQMETLKTRHDKDSKRMLKKIKKREHELKTYKKQTKEKEVLAKKRIDELEACIKNEEDTMQLQLLHGTLSGNTRDISHDTLSGNTSDTFDDTLSGSTSDTLDDPMSGNTSDTLDDTLSGSTSDTLDDTMSGNTSDTSDDTLSGNTSDTSDKTDTRQKQQQQQLIDACEYGTLDDIKKMVNIDVNVIDSWGETPLFKCCTSSVSPVDKIKYLVSHQADFNARDSINNTILHWACLEGTLSTVQYLVDDLHMHVNTTGQYNQTPLFDCCESPVSPVDKIEYLVSHQADINARTSNNNTILHWACLHGTLSTVQYLVDDLHMNVNTTGCIDQIPLFDCCWSSVSPVDKVKYLVRRQADINARTSNNTILHWACLEGTLSTVQYLVDDLHMNVNTTGYNNRTPLFYCCMSSVSPVDKIKYLVIHQADINARDSDNDTILHLACYYSTLYTVQYLVDCLHLDVHVRNKDGLTVLDYCRWSDTESDEKIKYIRKNKNK